MRIALALGSGGARGYAHIGVIRELEARGHEIVAVSGSSMGAVVGGVYAAGKLDEFEEWVRPLSQSDIVRLIDPALTGGGAIRARRVMGKLGGILDGVRIEDLRVPYTAVATDMRARREIWFNRGPLDVALRASFAIPSVITPAVVGERLLIDGGVMNPVPVEPLIPSHADILVAVSLTGRRGDSLGSVIRESSDEDDKPGRKLLRDEDEDRPGGANRRSLKSSESMSERTARIKAATSDFVDREFTRVVANRLLPALEEWEFGRTNAGTKMRKRLAERVPHEDGSRTDASGVATATDADADGGDDAMGRVTAEDMVSAEVDHAMSPSAVAETYGTLPKSLGMFDVVVQALDAVEAVITGYRLAGNPPDIHLSVPASVCSAFDFHRAEEVIEFGHMLCAEALDREEI